jgi:hypothetical protein
MAAAKRMIGSTHHHISVVDRTVRATATITGYWAINGKHGNKWEVLHIVTLAISTGECPITTHLVTILRNLIFLWIIDSTVGSHGCYETAGLLRLSESRVGVKVLLYGLAYAMSELWEYHPLLLGQYFVYAFHLFAFVLLKIYMGKVREKTMPLCYAKKPFSHEKGYSL